MKVTQTGWVIINIGHPGTESRFISSGTFRFTRKEAIKGFVKDSGETWEYWKRKYNFRCVKAEQIIQTTTKLSFKY